MTETLFNDETIATVEINKSCMVCTHIEKGGYHPKCAIRTDIDILTIPFRRYCELFILNENYAIK